MYPLNVNKVYLIELECSTVALREIVRCDKISSSSFMFVQHCGINFEKENTFAIYNKCKG